METRSDPDKHRRIHMLSTHTYLHRRATHKSSGSTCNVSYAYITHISNIFTHTHTLSFSHALSHAPSLSLTLPPPPLHSLSLIHSHRHTIKAHRYVSSHAYRRSVPAKRRVLVGRTLAGGKGRRSELQSARRQTTFANIRAQKQNAEVILQTAIPLEFIAIGERSAGLQGMHLQ